MCKFNSIKIVFDQSVFSLSSWTIIYIRCNMCASASCIDCIASQDMERGMGYVSYHMTYCNTFLKFCDLPNQEN